MKPEPLLALPGFAAAAAGLYALPFVALRPNRIATGAGLSLAAVSPAWAVALGLALAAIAAGTAAIALFGPGLAPRPVGEARGGKAKALRSTRYATLIVAALFPCLIVAALGAASTAALAGSHPESRASFGPGFWMALAASYVLTAALAPLQGEAAPAFLRAAAAATVAGILVLAASGALDSLSLARELANRRQGFLEALARHGAYALFPTAAALAVGLPLGYAASKSKAWDGPVFLVANAAQVVPTLSLLGLLVLPLSALGKALPALGAIGIGGIGWAPASIVLFLYALLPIAANARAGFRMADPAAIDAARGMGMGRARLFVEVELPLAAPAVAAGFRTALTQNMGNAVLAGLIGGGGMGSLVFLGLAQAAPDLVLLGALPVAAAAFAADRALAAAESLLLRKAGLTGASA